MGLHSVNHFPLLPSLLLCCFSERASQLALQALKQSREASTHFVLKVPPPDDANPMVCVCVSMSVEQQQQTE
jgi:hypothetical protein